jgi:hypothetical protein
VDRRGKVFAESLRIFKFELLTYHCSDKYNLPSSGYGVLVLNKRIDSIGVTVEYDDDASGCVELELEYRSNVE